MGWYLNNKYSKLYFNIINSARNRIYDSYTEIHHIRPASIGGSNSHHNLIKVSMREHYILHKLLPKMTVGDYRKRMISARWFMSAIDRKADRYHVNSREYCKYKGEWVATIRSNGNYDEILALVKSGARRPNEGEPMYASVMYYLRTDDEFRKYVKDSAPSWLEHIPRSGRPTKPTPSLVGRTYGELLVISDLPKQLYECKCSCGKILTINKYNLLKQKTCGHDKANHLVEANKKRMLDRFSRAKMILLDANTDQDIGDVVALLKSKSLPKELKDELYDINPSLRPRGCGSNNRLSELIEYVKSAESKKLTTKDNRYHAFIRFLKINEEFYDLVDAYKPEWITPTLRRKIK